LISEITAVDSSMPWQTRPGKGATRLMLRICSGTLPFFVYRPALIKLSVYHGTALDTSFLIDHLGSYVLSGPNAPHIDQHLILGISLGGHAAWQAFFNDPRVTAAIVIIGCPDYMRMFSFPISEYMGGHV